MSAKRSFIELDPPKPKGKKAAEGNKIPKILVLDLDRLNGVIQFFDEIGIEIFEEHKMESSFGILPISIPLAFDGLPVEFAMSDKLIEIRKQMLGELSCSFSDFQALKATLRAYQLEGVHWLERLRSCILTGFWPMTWDLEKRFKRSLPSRSIS